MPVLPPVLVDCPEPGNTFTPSVLEDDITIPSPESTVTCMMEDSFIPCYALILSITGDTDVSVPLSWIIYNSPTPSYYELYRRIL